MNLREKLLTAARRFCDDFAKKAPIDDLLSHFSTSQPCEVFEHGLHKFAPFLGTPFTGYDGVKGYFSTVASLIRYDHMHFREYAVDADERKVSVKGMATFTWTGTEQSWDETFSYVLDFDEENKVRRYQIWGDTGALYLASLGRLKEIINVVWFKSVCHAGAKYKHCTTPLPIRVSKQRRVHDV